VQIGLDFCCGDLRSVGATVRSRHIPAGWLAAAARWAARVSRKAQPLNQAAADSMRGPATVNDLRWCPIRSVLCIVQPNTSFARWEVIRSLTTEALCSSAIYIWTLNNVITNAETVIMFTWHQYGISITWYTYQWISECMAQLDRAVSGTLWRRTPPLNYVIYYFWTRKSFCPVFRKLFINTMSYLVWVVNCNVPLSVYFHLFSSTKLLNWIDKQNKTLALKVHTFAQQQTQWNNNKDAKSTTKIPEWKGENTDRQAK